jgi:hypothetical protein
MIRASRRKCALGRAGAIALRQGHGRSGGNIRGNIQIVQTVRISARSGRYGRGWTDLTPA